MSQDLPRENCRHERGKLYGVCVLNYDALSDLRGSDLWKVTCTQVSTERPMQMSLTLPPAGNARVGAVSTSLSYSCLFL